MFQFWILPAAINSGVNVVAVGAGVNVGWNAGASARRVDCSITSCFILFHLKRMSKV